VTSSQEKEIEMSKEKLESKNELDCEVTVFEGAHATCDQTEDDSAKKRSAPKHRLSRKEKTEEDYDI